MRNCEFFVLRYAIDAVKEEFVNFGVVLLEPGTADSSAADSLRSSSARNDKSEKSADTPGAARDGETFADVRVTREWSRVKCMDPLADTDMLEALEEDIRRELRAGAESQEKILKRLQDSFSNAVQLSGTKAVVTENPEKELEKLTHIYVESARPGAGRGAGARVEIKRALREWFVREGLWDGMRTNIVAADYAENGDPLKIDFARRNGSVRMWQAVPAGEVNAAKALAWSYPALRDGLWRKERLKAEMTAVVDAEEPFAVAAMRGAGIQVRRVNELMN